LVHICFVKCGNIGTSTVVDLLLDEIAGRDDLQFTIIGSGPKMTPSETERIGKLVQSVNPDLVVVCGPNAGAPGMVGLRKALKESARPKIVIGDGPSKRVRAKLEEEGFGYLIMEADPLIGARREFLDPTEMAIFNADVIKILAAVGSLRVVQEELDRAIDSLKGHETYLPRKIVGRTASLAKAGFSNPYARAKAEVAFQLAESAASTNYRACFVEKDAKKFMRLAASAHEAVRAGARIADEAREMEKGADSVLRTPHGRSGEILQKRSLMSKPKEVSK
jgi:methylenetetrahydromethanopterin dehydrogenase